jgi:TRAP-type C4-dicarboxylate transport system permease small subunit
VGSHNGETEALSRVVWVMVAVACVLLVGLDTFWLAGDVLSRWLFSKTWSGLFEITEYSLLWITLLGAGWVTKNAGHVRMDLLVGRLGPRPQRVVRIIALVGSAVALAIMVWFTAWLTIHDYRGGIKYTTVLEPPKWPVEMVMPVGFAIMLLYVCRDLYRLLKSR